MNETPQPMTFQADIPDAVLALLPHDRSTRILDAGAGQGYFSRKLKDLGYEVEACDILQDNFKCPDITFFKSDLSERIECESDRYDCVVSLEVIEHLENHFRFMSEIFRVTKPNGLVIITTPNILSIPSRLYFLLYGFNECGRKPLDPTRSEYFMQHINPISLPKLLFHIERCGGTLEKLRTNRIRKSAWLPMVLFYPLMAVAIRRKLLRKRHTAQGALYRRHIHWLLTPASLMGRITIAAARKRVPAHITAFS